MTWLFPGFSFRNRIAENVLVTLLNQDLERPEMLVACQLSRWTTLGMVEMGESNEVGVWTVVRRRRAVCCCTQVLYLQVRRSISQKERRNENWRWLGLPRGERISLPGDSSLRCQRSGWLCLVFEAHLSGGTFGIATTDLPSSFNASHSLIGRNGSYRLASHIDDQ